MNDTLFISPSRQYRIQFLRSLQEDLSRIGHRFNIIETEHDIELHYSPYDFEHSNPDEIKRLMHNAFGELKTKQINNNDNKDFIKKMENSGIRNYFAEGSEIKIDNINPEIRICSTQELKNIYRYCRYFQTVPNSSGVGRRFSAIIYDIGQEKEKIIGILGLQQATISSSARDEYLGWNSIDSKSEKERIKKIGLERTMQLSVVTAIPPYSYIFGSKLAAILALSNPIQEYFQKKYNKDPLLALFTTCAYGLHSAMYNRIQLQKISNNNGNNSNFNNEMYRRVGETNLISQAMISENTVSYAKEMFSKLPNQKSSSSFRTTLSKDRAILKALSVCGLSRKVLNMYPMGVYIGYLHKNNIDILRNGNQNFQRAFLDLQVKDVRNYWLSEIVHKKMKSLNLSMFHNHKIDSIILSNYIEED